MLRIAILENEETAKNIMFELAVLLKEEDCVFSYFSRISQFAKADIEKEYHVVIFHEKLEIPRVTQSFVMAKPQRIVIYSKSKLTPSQKEILPFARILYVERNNIKEELRRIAPYVKKLVMNQEEYLFSYNNVKVPLKISDIYYIEKEDKSLIYHTKRGEFRERKNMKDAHEFFRHYNFLWIHVSYLVNMDYIRQINGDMVLIANEELPIARAKKAEVMQVFRSFIIRK